MVEIQQALDRAMFAISLDLQEELKKASPVDTSTLRNSIKVFVTSKGLEIFMKEYGLYVEYGTPPHTIEPKNKKALKFKSGGENIIVKKVRHPGTRPNPFIRTTFKQKLAKIIHQRLMQELNR